MSDKSTTAADVISWIAQREQPSLYGHTHRRKKPMRTLTADLITHLKLSREAVDKLMAPHIASGAVIACDVSRPGLPVEQEYRIGNGIADQFRALPTSPDALRRLAVREPVRAHVPQIKPTQAIKSKTERADDSHLSRPERGYRYLQEHGPTFAYQLARSIEIACSDIRDCMRGLVNAGKVGLRQKQEGNRLRNEYFIPEPQDLPALCGRKAAPHERQSLALSVLRTQGPMLSMQLANAIGLLTANNIGLIMRPLLHDGNVCVRKVPSEVGPPTNQYFIPESATASVEPLGEHVYQRAHAPHTHSLEQRT